MIQTIDFKVCYGFVVYIGKARADETFVAHVY